MLPNPAQVTTLVPGQGTAPAAPGSQAALDPNANLLQVLQTLMAQNQPVIDINQATPDQKAAAEQQAKVESKTQKPAEIAPQKQEETGKLPGLLNFLGNFGIGENFGISDTGEPAKKASKEDKVTKAISGVMKLASLFGGL